MRKLVLLIAATILFAFPTVASADVFTFQAPSLFPNQGQGGPNQFDLDGYNQYTWRLDGVNVQGQSIMSATLTIHQVINASYPNPLFIHLLDSARFPQAIEFRDVPLGQNPITSINDNFAGIYYVDLPMVEPGTANTFLTQQSLTTTASDFVYTFTEDQLATLSVYFLNGNDIAFGFDPDGRFWNNGVTFTFTTCPAIPTPEPATLALLGSGLVGLYYRRRQKA